MAEPVPTFLLPPGEVIRDRPGTMWWSEHLNPDGLCPYGWTNCDGHHHHVRLPNGHAWCIDSRAGNCTLPDDTEHRCWIRHGEPPAIHVDKNGQTCEAGAGSILADDYHGFLHDGHLMEC